MNIFPFNRPFATLVLALAGPDVAEEQKGYYVTYRFICGREWLDSEGCKSKQSERRDSQLFKNSVVGRRGGGVVSNRQDRCKMETKCDRACVVVRAKHEVKGE